MKRPTLLCTLGVTLLLVGCSANHSPWASIPTDEKLAWQGIGMNALAAKELRGNGLTPAGTREWLKAGIKSPQEIAGWHRAGYEAHQALKWRMKGLTLQDAIALTR